ncbi:MAG: tryptophan--tRNA ligase [Acidimicrobiia bacterium]|nr:tryptophan--tRNA ligase [Acidimicrobiia bacterium]
MAKKKSLTGIKPTGTIHLGNIMGAFLPALELTKTYETNYFIADAHAITTVNSGDELRAQTLGVANSWLALGLDPEKSTFYKQSDIIDDFLLSWIFNCITPKGLMNRAHAYKAVVDQATQNNEKDPDAKVNMGIFSYPILMAADIILYSADVVPVGQDQKQHVEIARDIANKFNKNYGNILTVPQPLIEKSVATLPGIDHRKMSKSYNNIISIFCSDDEMWNQIKKFKTDSSPVGEPKNADDVPLFKLIETISTKDVSTKLKSDLKNGDYSWGSMKELLFEQIKHRFVDARAKYFEFDKDPSYVDKVLKEGAEKAQQQASELMLKVRAAVGL